MIRGAEICKACLYRDNKSKEEPCKKCIKIYPGAYYRTAYTPIKMPGETYHGIRERRDDGE